jgi:hypothetical protein
MSASLFAILYNLQIGDIIHQAIKYTKDDKNDVLICLFYLHYHHLRCHSNGVCAHRRSTCIKYFVVLVSDTKVERRTDYEILVLYILRIPIRSCYLVYVLGNQ